MRRLGKTVDWLEGVLIHIGIGLVITGVLAGFALFVYGPSVSNCVVQHTISSPGTKPSNPNPMRECEIWPWRQ